MTIYQGLVCWLIINEIAALWFIEREIQRGES